MDILPVEQPTSYDLVPYSSRPFRQTHPDRLAVIATLAGLKPAPVESCRVLELACAAGGNLIPMAAALPGSTFVGIDLSAKQVEAGQRVVETLGLTNVELQRKNIQEITPEFGKFDYIIAHGVFSWVPQTVQDKILSICAENLNPNGVAYVSYNTLPGWRMRSIVRDMMAYHGRRFTDPPTQIGQAKALLEFVVKSLEGQTTPYATMLRDELKLVQSVEDSYLFHEHLEDENRPQYFFEFVGRASGYGLRYLGEADAFTMAPRSFSADVQQVLHKISPDIVHLEQYMDFLRNRMFRQTLLCLGWQVPNYQLKPAHAEGFRIACRLQPKSPTPDTKSQANEQFQGPGDVVLSSQSPVIKTATVFLAERWPASVAFQELIDAVGQRLDLGPSANSQLVEAVGTFVLNTYTSSNVLELSLTPPAFTLTPGDRPVGSRLARKQAESAKMVSNLRHESVALGDAERQMLLLLDGTTDRPALASRIEDLVKTGVLVARREGQPVTEPNEARQIVEKSVDPMLQWLARSALLTA